MEIWSTFEIIMFTSYTSINYLRLNNKYFLLAKPITKYLTCTERKCFCKITPYFSRAKIRWNTTAALRSQKYSSENAGRIEWQSIFTMPHSRENYLAKSLHTCTVDRFLLHTWSVINFPSSLVGNYLHNYYSSTSTIILKQKREVYEYF